jgi:hypothetical protein
MGTLDDFLSAQTIRFTRLAGPSGQLSSGFCLSKPQGSLDLWTDSRTFRFTDDFEFQLSGEHVKDDPQGNPIVKWTAKAYVGLVSGDLRYTQLDAALLAVVAPVTPFDGTRCDGNPARYGVELTSLNTLDGKPFDNHVVAAYETLSVGFHRVPVHEVHGLSFHANAGRLSVVPKLVLGIDSCGIGPSAGGVATVYSEIPTIIAADRVDVTWSTTGGTPMGPTTDPHSFQVVLPSTPITVTCTVTVETQKFSSSLVVAPETPQSIALKTLRCRLRGLVHNRGPLQPLLDGDRDLVKTPLTRSELQHVSTYAKALHEHSQRLLDAEERHVVTAPK